MENVQWVRIYINSSHRRGFKYKREADFGNTGFLSSRAKEFYIITVRTTSGDTYRYCNSIGVTGLG